MTSIAHQIPEEIVHKLILSAYRLTPHPCSKIIKQYAISFWTSNLFREGRTNTMRGREIQIWKDYRNNLISDDELLEKHQVYTWDKLMMTNGTEGVPLPHNKESIDLFHEHLNWRMN